MTRRKKIHRFQTVAVDGRNLLELGPRYERLAYDDSTIVSVFHRTLGGRISVSLEREEFSRLAGWLAAERPSRVEFENAQTTLRFERGNLVLQEIGGDSVNVLDGLLVEVCWNGSGRFRSALLDAVGRRALLDWVADKDANGWEGWKSGRTEGRTDGPT